MITSGLHWVGSASLTASVTCLTSPHVRDRTICIQTLKVEPPKKFCTVLYSVNNLKCLAKDYCCLNGGLHFNSQSGTVNQHHWSGCMWLWRFHFFPNDKQIVSIFFLTQGERKMSGDLPLNINIKEPRWDQGTFMGRAKHFFMITDPRNVLLSSTTLEEARVIVENYR